MAISISPSGFFGSIYFLEERPSLSDWNTLRIDGTFVISPAYVGDNDYEYVGYNSN